MRLTAGARLGPYEIVAPLGAGGMGEVYRARDTRLGRDVAVKILSADTSSSPDARQRFEREARTISQLSHPNICALYDVGEAPNPQSLIPYPYLVMELLDGETLAQRLASGPLPLELTLRYASQIADALDKAHRQGIVHRDLKPSNAMITKGGVKLLDFGLAKAVAPMSVSVAETLPMAQPLTARGAIAGTLQYMAPEQMEGRPADARSDIYALGAVIYEMATGKPAFGTALRPLDPPALDRIVRACRATDPDERWQSAHDVRMQLGALADTRDENETAGAAASASDRRGWIRWLPWTVAAAAACVAAVAWLRPTPPARQGLTPIRFSQSPPSGGAFFESYESTGLSVSPDGSRLAFTARVAGGPLRVWTRGVAELDAKPIAGTEGATSLFWSPDGRSLAFFASGKLRRIDWPGGSPVSICDVREGIGHAGTWGDGQILFSSIEGEAVYRVAAGGGTPLAVLKPDPAHDEARLNWPFFLPDGRRFLYLQRRLDGSGHLLLADPGRATREVRPMQSSAQYVGPGYLVFASEGALVGQRFDLSRGIVVGDPFSIADSVGYFLTTTIARFSTSPTGTLVYASHDDEQRLAWFDGAGREVTSAGERGRYQLPRIAPDGRRLAFSRIRGGAFDIWEADLERPGETRLTFGLSSENMGPWMPDGRSLLFSADVGAPPRIFRKDLISGREEPVLPGTGTFQNPEDVSADGKMLLFTQRVAGGGDIWMFGLDGSRPPTPIVETPSDEEGVRFSPDGHAFSFHSNASGRYEVYAAPFPPTGEKIRVSTGGGTDARWSRDGRTLFYGSADEHLMSVPMATNPSLRAGIATALFEMRPPWLEFDVSPAGRFVAVVPVTRSREQPLTVVLNWAAALDR